MYCSFSAASDYSCSNAPAPPASPTQPIDKNNCSNRTEYFTNTCLPGYYYDDKMGYCWTEKIRINFTPKICDPDLADAHPDPPQLWDNLLHARVQEQ